MFELGPMSAKRTACGRQGVHMHLVSLSTLGSTVWPSEARAPRKVHQVVPGPRHIGGPIKGLIGDCSLDLFFVFLIDFQVYVCVLSCFSSF